MALFPVENGGGFSYIGMIIESTTLDTEAKVKAVYGGTTWIQHSGYMLRGATSGVTANDATKTGGSDDAVVVSHNHRIYESSVSGSGTYHVQTAGGNGQWNGAYTESTGTSGTNKNIPNYKSVYIWERTA